MLKRIVRKHLGRCHLKINQRNRKRLLNKTPTLVCSNCIGGFLYHWLGLQFRSPFINLYMTDKDFLIAMENWDSFWKTEIKEVTNSEYNYPLGEGYQGVKIHFMHYQSFDEAKSAWDRRKIRINTNNMVVILANYEGDPDILQRFDMLPFKNKIVFVDEPTSEKSAIYLKKYKIFKKKCNKRNKISNIFLTQNYITGKRFIDQFDYVDYLNKMLY